MKSTRSPLAATVLGISLAFGGVVATALPAAAASPAATAFSRCMDGYLDAQRNMYTAHQDSAALAFLYVGYANCYYDLSQRSDITSDQEISAINNYNHYLPLAQQAIGKAGATYYKNLLKFGLRGLRA